MFIINNSLKRDAKRTILTFTGSKYYTIKLIKLMSPMTISQSSEEEQSNSDS